MKNKFLRLGQIFFGLIILVFFVYVFFNFAEIKKIPEILGQVKLYFLIPLLILEFLFVINRGKIFTLLYNYFGVPVNWKEMIKLYLASNTANVVAPSGGISGIVLFMSQAEDQETSKTRVLLINGFYYFIGYIDLAIILIVGISYLAYLEKLNSYIIATFIILLAILFVVGIALMLAKQWQKLLTIFSEGLIKFINFFLRLFKMGKIDQEKAEKLGRELIHLRTMLMRTPMVFFRPFGLFLLGNVIEITILGLIFLSFGTIINPMILIAGYAIGLLFMLISITPSGVGIAEPIMALAFLSMGIHIELAALVVIIFRIITFWLPLPFGIAVSRKYLVKS